MTNRPAQSPGALAGAGRAKRLEDHIELLAVGASDAAAMLGVSERTLASLTARNAVPSIKVCRRRLYRTDDLRAWLAAGAPCTPGAAASLRRGGAA